MKLPPILPYSLPCRKPSRCDDCIGAFGECEKLALPKTDAAEVQSRTCVRCVLFKRAFWKSWVSTLLSWYNHFYNGGWGIFGDDLEKCKSFREVDTSTGFLTEYSDDGDESTEDGSEGEDGSADTTAVEMKPTVRKKSAVMGTEFMRSLTKITPTTPSKPLGEDQPKEQAKGAFPKLS
jgi:hypothetical protein